MNKFNLQLYSVKHTLDDDFEGTLRAISDMGYDGVEFAGNYGGLTGAELNEFLESVGLTAVSAHISLEELENNFDYHKDILKACDCRYMICPWADVKTAKDAQALGKRLEAISEKCAMNGFLFGYHNHAHEFATAENGDYLFDIIMDNAGPLTLCQFDVYWIKFAGADIDEMIRKYAGRINLMHLKQFDIKDEKKYNSTLDKGLINFAEVMRTAKMLGTEHFIIEQEGDGSQELADARTNIIFARTIKA